jgi:hypothetical protein
VEVSKMRQVFLEKYYPFCDEKMECEAVKK